jgi:hypothetical protein
MDPQHLHFQHQEPAKQRKKQNRKNINNVTEIFFILTAF